tara:strand:+ start:2207 stop:2983 length:777 start_codon:yes stop_codon:yes gene_type:complete
LLAAGTGSRLLPLTKDWPKCLMPINGYPLLGYWLQILENAKIKSVLVNLHHHHKYVKEFLLEEAWSIETTTCYEEVLLGTAGTLINNHDYFSNSSTLLIHADNWCHCDFNGFVEYHRKGKPENCLITMMTFQTTNPESCGIVEVDKKGIVQAFHEKSENANGNMANAAIYLIEPEVLQWIKTQNEITDFSTQVIPKFLGKIATWQNTEIHRDVGSFEQLKKAQEDDITFHLNFRKGESTWSKRFAENPIHELIGQITL